MPDLARILSDVLDRPEADRATFLDEACGNDVNLRSEVEALIKAHEGAGSFLDAPLVTGPPVDATVQATLSEGPGTVIDKYKLLQLIGEGGFGAVYMAEQREPVKRKIALKIIKLGMDTKQVIARFEAERQALAMMDHPNIAKVLDAGATETGRPYFVMDLVKGVPITEYCDTENLTTKDRLDLFIKVCNAVQHAHQKGIIHRDLKPSNVMVTLHDGKPVPKVIDFGIAKATNRELTDKTLFTEYRQFIGTPEYMSPEQAEMSGLDIDTRSDIYSLGVLLYQLLTGTTPFDGARLRSAAINEIQRIIREEEPSRPSTRLSEMGRSESITSRGREGAGSATSGQSGVPLPDGRGSLGRGSSDRTSIHSIAKHRRTDPASLSKQLRGDLDWIIMKAMEKDRGRRYETPSSFAADIQRHLDDLPVEAGPPRVGYRLAKLVRRERPRFVAAAVVLVAIVTSGTIWAASLSSQRLDRQTRSDLLSRTLDRATTHAARAVAARISDVSAWLEARSSAQHVGDLLEAGEVNTPVRDRADVFLSTFAQDDRARTFAEQVEEIVITSATHMDSESWLRMERLLVEAFRLYDIDLNTNSPDEVIGLINQSKENIRLAEALELWLGTIGQLMTFGHQLIERDEFDAWIPVLYATDDDPIRTTVRKMLYSGVAPDLDELDALFEGVDLHDVDARTLSWAGMLYGVAGTPERAEGLMEGALLVHPDDFMLNFDRALGLAYSQDWNRAIRYYMRCLAIRPDTSGIWRSMGNAMRENGELNASERALRRAVELDEGHAPTHIDLATTLLARGDHEGAVAICRRVLVDHLRLATAHACLGRALLASGDREAARAALETGLSLAGDDLQLSTRIRGWLEETAEDGD